MDNGIFSLTRRKKICLEKKLENTEINLVKNLLMLLQRLEMMPQKLHYKEVYIKQ